MAGMESPAALAEFATELAVATARKITAKRAELSRQGDLRDYTMTKSSAVDPVTIVDTAAEDFVVGEINARRPQDGIIGEEGADQPSSSGISWIVDPIDGTVNFIYGIPHHAVSIAASYDGEVVAGAVCNVVTLEVWSAARGHGATVTRDGETTALRVNEVESLEQSLLATGFGYRAAQRRRQGEIVGHLLPQVRDIRRLGSAALDLCHLAEGRVDMYYEHGLHCWDFAAGAIIAREAGARVVHPALSVSGQENGLTLASSPAVFTAASEALHALGAGEHLGR